GGVAKVHPTRPSVATRVDLSPEVEPPLPQDLDRPSLHVRRRRYVVRAAGRQVAPEARGAVPTATTHLVDEPLDRRAREQAHGPERLDEAFGALLAQRAEELEGEQFRPDHRDAVELRDPLLRQLPDDVEQGEARRPARTGGGGDVQRLEAAPGEPPPRAGRLVGERGIPACVEDRRQDLLTLRPGRAPQPGDVVRDVLPLGGVEAL